MPKQRLGTPRSPHDQVRAEAAWVVERTLSSRAPVDAFLDKALERSDPRDAGLLWELVLGTLRWLRRLDYVIDRVSDRGIEKIEPALLPPLRVGVYQLLFLDRVPVHAVVNEAVEHARSATHRGGASFVNAVLRRIARESSPEAWPVRGTDPIRKLAVELSHPDFLVRRWCSRIGAERTRRLLEANNRPKPLHLMAFRDRGGRELLAERLIDEGCEVEPSALAPLGLKVRSGRPFETAAFQRGDFYVQDEAGQASALVPPPMAAETVLDVAASPGGKSFALMAAEPEVRCTMADLDLTRLMTLRSNRERLRRQAPILVADGRRLPFGAGFDRVVVDAPCSGTGTLRKHPELKWRLSESEIERLAAGAVDLLGAGAETVRPGGLLILVTCSLEEEENEGATKRLREARPDFAPADLEGRVPPCGEHVPEEGSWRLWTAGDHDGFSVSVLRRRR